jgi:serine/threonine protein kinase
MATLVGTSLGRYEIEEELGRGAMGVVYRARDPKIDRTVAIKTVSLSGLGPDAEEEYRQRFVVEARAAGRLSHSGIVAIFDVGEEAETRAPYLVMEYIEGQSLHQLLSGDNSRLPLSTALRLAQETAEALHYAHEQGVVHRDIKPANILVALDGNPKIADFGIAKLNQSDLTLPGQVLGSPAYMAPEQLSEEQVDGRSDLFSLGVILYFMLTGHRPFQGNSTATVCFKLANREPVTVMAFDSSFPPELDQIVSRAIAKDPTQRYQSGMEMASDIQRLRARLGSPQQSATLTARRLKQRAVPDLPKSKHRLTPHFAKGVIVAWPFRLRWGHFLALAILAGALGFFFSHLHDISPRSNLVLAREPAIGSNKSAVAVPPVRPNAKLHIEIDHQFTQARASMWLDNQPVYSRVLHADPKNHMLFFRKVQGHESDGVQLPAGKHQLRVRVQSPLGAYDQSKTLTVNFTPKGEKTLQLNCDAKHHLLRVTLQ